MFHSFKRNVELQCAVSSAGVHYPVEQQGPGPAGTYSGTPGSIGHLNISE